jgi:hypothetical protein
MGGVRAQEPAQVDRDIRSAVDRLRAMKADSGLTVEYNRQMDAAWKLFNTHRDRALPILRAELASEMAKQRPADMVLLDIGYFLHRSGETSDKDLARNALFALDPTTELIRWNGQQLFYFTHGVAAEYDPRVLPLIDRAFLQDGVRVFVPQHSMQLDETLTCVFLYGVYGKDAEARVRAALTDPKRARRAMEVLVWLGSPESNAAIEDVMRKQRDYETFARAAAFLMQAGGPQGRAIMLRIEPATLDPKSAQYYASIRGAVEATTFARYRVAVARLPGDTKLSDAEVRARLAAMRAKAGRDESTSPAAILDSRLPRETLIEELVAIRSLTFKRISDEALSDVKVTNLTINALRFRDP